MALNAFNAYRKLNQRPKDRWSFEGAKDKTTYAAWDDQASASNWLGLYLPLTLLSFSSPFPVPPTPKTHISSTFFPHSCLHTSLFLFPSQFFFSPLTDLPNFSLSFLLHSFVFPPRQHLVFRLHFRSHFLSPLRLPVPTPALSST